MRSYLIAAVTSIGMLAATPSYAWEINTVLLASVIWNGPSSSYIATFKTGPSCEAAFVSWSTDLRARIIAARPTLIAQGIYPVFGHTCSPGQ